MAPSEWHLLAEGLPAAGYPARAGVRVRIQLERDEPAGHVDGECEGSCEYTVEFARYGEESAAGTSSFI